ncbi:hypothetical protein BD289DRAFT_98907 [Coniella lustricola]|uniref:Uncharacterized protein n=1 Tax=Coniella lustricola TaxID=2025994 RepID=A0A2T3AN89_9PEZI|nr:hypothetical protein BD289DRAFT_98907 [Coniella lustricola]
MEELVRRDMNKWLHLCISDNRSMIFLLFFFASARVVKSTAQGRRSLKAINWWKQFLTRDEYDSWIKETFDSPGILASLFTCRDSLSQQRGRGFDYSHPRATPTGGFLSNTPICCPKSIPVSYCDPAAVEKELDLQGGCFERQKTNALWPVLALLSLQT